MTGTVFLCVCIDREVVVVVVGGAQNELIHMETAASHC